MERADNGTVDNSDNSNDNDTANSSEKLLVLPLGKESKKITQVITNDTARQIIELLAEDSMSASDIATQLGVPLTTIKYNLENLVDVGLIKIERIKYSEKGRQVKVYAPIRKLIVLVPGKTDSTTVMDVLKKYLGLIFAAVFASGLVEMITRSDGTVNSTLKGGSSNEFMSTPLIDHSSNISEGESHLYYDMDDAVNITPESLLETTGEIPIEAPTSIPETAQKLVEIPTHTIIDSVEGESIRITADPALTQHLGLWFLFGSLFIITLIIIIDYYRIKK
jgi:predicted transcriptional regulator